MTLSDIKSKIEAGRFSIFDHALTEAFSDGITIFDILYSIERGKIIEDNPDRKRCLIFGRLKDKTPLHVVIDYSLSEEVEIVTVYVPDPRQWINFRIRRRKGPDEKK